MSKKTTFAIETIISFTGYKTSDGGLFATATQATKRQNEINLERFLMGLIEYVDFQDGDYDIHAMIKYLRENRQAIIKLLYDDANGLSDPFQVRAEDQFQHQTITEFNAKFIFEAGWDAFVNSPTGFKKSRAFEIWWEKNKGKAGQ